MKETLTRNRLANAYLELIEKKPADSIKITELCQQAGVPRSTFYNSFQNLYELEKYAQDYIISLGKSCFQGENYQKSILDFLLMIRSHDKIYRSILFSGYSNDSQQNPVLFAFYQSAADDNLKKIEKEPDETEQLTLMKIHFYMNGVLSIIKYWMQTDYEIPAKKVRDLIVSLLPE